MDGSGRGPAPPVVYPVVALAGRRIDAPDAEQSRFPLSTVNSVRTRLLELFCKEGVRVVVSSAAAGADLLAQDVAGELGLQRRVLLPLEAEEFRASSVVDRPGPWGALFDRLLAEVTLEGGLVRLGDRGRGDYTYAAANRAIIEEAERLTGMTKGADAPASPLLAVLVWDLKPRDGQDFTADFGQLARSRGHRVVNVSTLPPSVTAG